MERFKRRRMIVGLAVGLIVIVLMAGGYLALRPRTVQVQLSTVKRQTIQDQVFASGTVRPVQRQVVMASQLAAPVDEFRVQVGDRVKKGQVLLTLQSPQASPYAGFGPSATAVVRAKFDGIVLQENPDGLDETGNPVPVIEVVSQDKQIVTDVSEVDAVRLKPGMSARVSTDAFPNQAWQAQIARVADYAHQTQGSAGVVEVDLSVPRTFPVPLGYDVDVRITSETHTQVPVVPYDALIPNGDGYAVFVYAAGRVRKVPVTLGITTDTVVEIARGLKPGERIVVNPPSNLQDGEAVTPV